jgi:hypothetical protein
LSSKKEVEEVSRRVKGGLAMDNDIPISIERKLHMTLSKSKVKKEIREIKQLIVSRALRERKAQYMVTQ